jgi:hypothetical protein
LERARRRWDISLIASLLMTFKGFRLNSEESKHNLKML